MIADKIQWLGNSQGRDENPGQQTEEGGALRWQTEIKWAGTAVSMRSPQKKQTELVVEGTQLCRDISRSSFGNREGPN